MRNSHCHFYTKYRQDRPSLVMLKMQENRLNKPKARFSFRINGLEPRNGQNWVYGCFDLPGQGNAAGMGASVAVESGG